MPLKFYYMPLSNSWFARDITKNQTKKLSILLSFFIHEVLQHLTPLYKQILFLVPKGS